MRTRWHFMTHSRAISATRCVGASSARRRRILRSPKTRTARFCSRTACAGSYSLSAKKACAISAPSTRDFITSTPTASRRDSACAARRRCACCLSGTPRLSLSSRPTGKCPSRRFVTKFSPFSPGRVRRYPNAWTGRSRLSGQRCPISRSRKLRSCTSA